MRRTGILRILLASVLLMALAAITMVSPISNSSGSLSESKVKGATTDQPNLPVRREGADEVLVTAEGVVILDLNSGRVLYEKYPHVRMKPASLTKIMTALVAMEHYQEDAVLTVHNGPATLGSAVELMANDELTTNDLLYALLVPSGNDAAVTLAENYTGGYQKFVERMNEKVVELGLQNTHFANVSGVESLDHYTSAHDITVIARKALESRLFAKIVETPEITINSLKGNKYKLESTNVLLGNGDIFGIKTGWTPEAGECLVILAERDNHPIVVSILNSKDRFGEGRKLVDWVYQTYTWK